MSELQILVCPICLNDKWRYIRRFGVKRKVCGAWFGCYGTRGKWMIFDEWNEQFNELYPPVDGDAP